MKENLPHSNSLRLAVAYRDNKTGDEQYFVCQVAYHPDIDLVPVLLHHAHTIGGHDLAQALEHYMKWTKNPWAIGMKVETVNMVEFHNPINVAEGTLPSIPMISKMKITMEGTEQYPEAGYINYANGGMIWTNPNYYYQPKINTAPKGLDQLPGLRASVKHPRAGVEASCPRKIELRRMIVHLNDFHRWTREQIADWLDEISDPTGETGPDLRFGTEPAKVESENPCAEVTDAYGKGANGHHDHIHVSYDDLANSYDALKGMHLHVNLPEINPEALKLLMGETNEQD